jgi:hypothetical protein
MLRNVDDRERFHGLITSATLNEVSMTPTPANPHARVLHRYRQSPVVEFYDIAKAWVNKLAEIVELTRATAATAAAAATATAAERDRRAAVLRPRVGAMSRPTEFKRLVEEMNRHAH